MSQRVGKSQVPPESFFVKAMKKEGPLLAGEVERAASWALGIHQQYETLSNATARSLPSHQLGLGHSPTV